MMNVDARAMARASNPEQKYNQDAQLRGRSVPVFPVRLRRWRARSGLRCVFVAAQEFVSFNLSNHTDSAWFVAFGSFDAAETTDLNGSGKRDLMWQRQEDLHGRAGGDLLRKEKVDPAGTYIPGLRGSLTDRRPARPSNDHR